jgi:hypothetical protein
VLYPSGIEKFSLQVLTPQEFLKEIGEYNEHTQSQNSCINNCASWHNTRFEQLAALGTKLVALHTLDSKAAPVLKAVRHALSSGSDSVEKPRYDAPKRRIWTNDTQNFDNVDAEVYSFKIGGYTVADKWLADRKGRTLSFEERRLYPQILIALAETRRTMAEIEALES